MAPTMTTRNASRRTAATRGGRTGGQTGRRGRRTEEQTGRVGGRTSDQGSQGKRMNGGVDEVPDFSTVIAQKLQGLLPTIVAQVGDHISNQGINGSRNDNATDDNIQEDDRNVNLGNDRNGCSYKEFVACKPNELDGKGSAVKYSADSLTDRALTWWNSEVKTRGREAVVSPSLSYPETKRIERYIYGLALQICGMVAATTPPTIQSAILKDKVLTDKNGSLKRTGERRGDGGESTKEGNVKGDNKRARNGKLLAIITNPIRKEYTGSKPKCTNCNFHHNLETPSRACMNCNRLGHFSRDCRARPRMVNLLNGKNPTTAHGECYECGGTDIYKSTCPRLNRAPGQGGNYQN
ncbi:reverse transcriptase domain-containing protein [Tanacetum coccineum]